MKGLEDVKKRHEKVLATARQAIDFGDFRLALPALNDLLEDYEDIPDLYYLRALSHTGLRNPAAAATDIRAGLAIDPNNPTAYRELGRVLTQLEDYPGAAMAFTDYVAKLPERTSERRRTAAAKELADAKMAAEIAGSPFDIDPQPLPGRVNTTEHQEYFPLLSVDGRRLLFTRNIRGANEDFYESRRLEDGTWDEPYPLQGINSPYNEAAQTVSADGRYLVFTICGRDDGMGSCDLYYSQRDGKGRWSEPANLSAVNSEFRETQPSLSANGDLLFFASNRGGGQGKHDIYLSGRRADGSWTTPVNLGATVNTAEEDLFPFWAADGQTLYFTSTGHPGLGAADLFRTQLDTANHWTEPRNLGYPINSSRSETNLFIALDGRTALYSRGSEGSRLDDLRDVDIYTFELPEPLRPTPATYLAAEVVDAVTGAPLQTTVRLRPTDGSRPTTVRRTNPDGTFVTVMPAGHDYALTVDQQGYLFYSDRFELSDTVADPKRPFRLRIELQPLTEELPVATEADGSIRLNNVLFETGKADLLPVSTDELDRLAGLLNERPNLRVEIAGHTDNVGGTVANQELSERRAAAVSNYLAGQGIAADRIQTIGYGETQPVADNGTAAGRAENRRTTFRLLR